MNTTLKALLLIPLALLASCATGPKLTPEMEALRLSLNQRMANTSSVELIASAGTMPSGAINETLIKNEIRTTTTISPNGDIIINRSEVTSGGPNKKSLRTAYARFATLKMGAHRLKSAEAELSDIGKKGASFSDAAYRTDGNENHIARAGSAYECLLDTDDFEGWTTVKNYSEPSDAGKMFISFLPTIAESPDKAFIEGIVRDMNRFIELYKALPK